MKKYPFTARGAEDFLADIYQYSDTRLFEIGMLIAQDTVGYIAEHFELQVQQLEYLRCLPIGLRQVAAWNIAAAVMARLPIKFHRAEQSPGDQKGFELTSNFSLSSKSSGNYSMEDQTNVSITIL